MHETPGAFQAAVPAGKPSDDRRSAGAYRPVLDAAGNAGGDVSYEKQKIV